MIRERSELDAIASEIHASGQPIALDLETYGTSEDKKIRKGETLDPWRGEIRLLSLQLPDRVPWLIDLRATGYGLGELGKVLEATEVIGHNIKFDADSFQRRFETGQLACGSCRSVSGDRTSQRPRKERLGRTNAPGRTDSICCSGRGTPARSQGEVGC